MRWIEINAGRFTMGLTDDEAWLLARVAAARARRNAARDPDQLHEERELAEVAEKWGNADYLKSLLTCAQPVHDVELSEFRISATPVTIANYARFVQATGATLPEDWNASRLRTMPVTGISWHDARAYADWCGATLPAEAQWERAARGPRRSLFPWGNEWGAEGERLDQDAQLVPVGSRPDRATSEGVHDLVTFAYEWCSDEFARYPGAPDAAREPAPNGGWDGTRVRRGGPILGLPPSAVTRWGAVDTLRLRDTTFRLVMKGSKG